MSVITCKLNLFAYEQEIYLVTDNSIKLIGKAPLENLDRALVDLCINKQVYKLHLYGVDEFATELASSINKTEKALYAMENKIEIEVN